jgi:lysophospholipase L1-like esterase
MRAQAALMLMLFGVATGPVDAAQAVTIMPLGNSITHGSGKGFAGGYRYYLGLMLAKDSFQVDFVGTLSSGGHSMDCDHEGHPGWVIQMAVPNTFTCHAWDPGNNRPDTYYDGLLEHYAGFVARIGSAPDFVLLMIGTNDVIKLHPETPTLAHRYAELVRAIHAVDTATRILAATIPPMTMVFDSIAYPDQRCRCGDLADSVALTNVRLLDTLQALRRVGLPLTIVPVHESSVVAESVRRTDGVHPDKQGYEAIAQLFYRELRPLLDAMPVPGEEKRHGGTEAQR